MKSLIQVAYAIAKTEKCSLENKGKGKFRFVAAFLTATQH